MRLDLRRLRRFLGLLPGLFVSHLKRVPTRLLNAFRLLLRGLFGSRNGPVIPSNPYYDELEVLHQQGSIDLEHVDSVVVPLLLTRGKQIDAMYEEHEVEQRRGRVEQQVGYAIIVVLLVVMGFLYGEISTVADGNKTAIRRLDEQDREQMTSRRIGRATTCAIQSASIQAAIETIKGSVKQYPPESARRRQANAVARRYAETIARAVEKAARVSTSGPPAARTGSPVGTIVRKDGTLDCGKLAALSSTNSGR